MHINSETIVILDMDGVIKSAPEGITLLAFKELCRRLNVNPSDHFDDSTFLQWYNSDYHKNYKKLGIQPAQYDWADQVYTECALHHSVLYGWVYDFVSELSTKCRIALLSSNTEANITASLHDIITYFSLITHSGMVRNLKPDPEGVMLILNQLDGTRDNAILIGDTDADIGAGARAEIYTGLVSWGLRRDFTVTSGHLKPHYVFTTPTELCSFFGLNRPSLG